MSSLAEDFPNHKDNKIIIDIAELFRRFVLGASHTLHYRVPMTVVSLCLVLSSFTEDIWTQELINSQHNVNLANF